MDLERIYAGVSPRPLEELWRGSAALRPLRRDLLLVSEEAAEATEAVSKALRNGAADPAALDRLADIFANLAVTLDMATARLTEEVNRGFGMIVEDRAKRRLRRMSARVDAAERGAIGRESE